MLLTESKNSVLVKPKLKVDNVKELQFGHYSITLSSESIAPFVLLDFKLGSGIRGQFRENGFFVFDGQKTITFVSDMKLSEQQIKQNLVIKTVTDVI